MTGKVERLAQADAPVSEARAQMRARVEAMTQEELALLRLFADQIVACYDPEVVAQFLAWRNDPRIGSLLQIAAALGDDMRDELLFRAEDCLRHEIAGHR
jgi:hypothetical protein